MSKPNHGLTKLSAKELWALGFALLLVYFSVSSIQDDIAREPENQFHRELVNNRHFTSALDRFFTERHRLPLNALELDKFMTQWANRAGNEGWNDLEKIVMRDWSYINSNFGRQFGWDNPIFGYGQSYDDFDKYAKRIQIGEITNPGYSELSVNVYIPGCQSKLLYHYDKAQKNFLLLTCQGDQLRRGGRFIQNEFMQDVYLHPEKGLEGKNHNIITNGTPYIHKQSKKIISDQFLKAELKAGRITDKDRDNWLQLDYKDLNGNKPKAN